MKVTDFDADLVAYIALAEVCKFEEDSSILEDVTSKMNVHAKKMKVNNTNFKLRI